MKRRKFLSQLGYTVPAAFLLPSLLSSSCKKDNESGIQKDKKFKNIKVIVIGAGAAGLYAGWYMNERGFDVTILEANDRVGGRVRSLSGFADFDIELGAEEVHGNNSEWYNIVQQTKATFLTDDTDDFYFSNAFNQGPNPGPKKFDEANQNVEFQKAMNFIANAENYSGPDKIVEQHLYDQGVSFDMYGISNAMLGNEYGADNIHLSVKGLAEEAQLWSSGDENYMLKDKSLLSVLETKFAPVMSKVQKNVQVKKVDSNGSNIVLTDQNNKTYEADKIVVTVPLKVLQDGDVVFTPGLPSTKQEALTHIGMGPGMKAVFKFSQPFWENILAPNLGSVVGSSSIPEFWVTNHGRGQTPTITALIMGDKAAQYSTMSPNDLRGELLFQLDNIFAIGNVASNSIEQDGFRLMDWSKEPFIKGAYSYPVVGGGLIFRKELAEAIDGRIFFAGEATHTKGHSGTVHGAIETGIRAVEEVEASVG